jgi:hypothetical protein
LDESNEAAEFKLSVHDNTDIKRVFNVSSATGHLLFEPQDGILSKAEFNAKFSPTALAANGTLLERMLVTNAQKDVVYEIVVPIYVRRPMLRPSLISLPSADGTWTATAIVIADPSAIEQLQEGTLMVKKQDKFTNVGQYRIVRRKAAMAVIEMQFEDDEIRAFGSSCSKLDVQLIQPDGTAFVSSRFSIDPLKH